MALRRRIATARPGSERERQRDVRDQDDFGIAEVVLRQAADQEADDRADCAHHETAVGTAATASENRGGSLEEGDEDPCPCQEAEDTALDEDLQRGVVQVAAGTVRRLRRRVHEHHDSLHLGDGFLQHLKAFGRDVEVVDRHTGDVSTGLARVATKPAATGSPTGYITIVIVLVAFFAVCVAAVATVSKTSTGIRTSSVAK
ncbi:MAG TPA: hypothetical protein VEL76_35145, partial [Gemmataceae bacterium]|nr:hypothetical protein [Gemmataceae bacterium]